MSTTRTRGLALVLGPVALALAVGGCSSGSEDATATSQPPRTVVVTSTESPAPTTTSSVTPTSTSGSGASDRCRAGQLVGALTPAAGGASAGSMHYELTLTNTGSASCTTGGYPGVSFVGDGNGTQLGAPARRDGTGDAAVRLAPGQAVSADLTVAQAANFPDCSPQTADGLRVYPPDDLDSLFVRASGLTACRSSAVLLTVSPLR